MRGKSLPGIRKCRRVTIEWDSPWNKRPNELSIHTGALHTCLLDLNIICRKTHACNQTDFLHQISWGKTLSNGERHWQSPCNHSCQVSIEELKLQSLACHGPLTGGLRGFFNLTICVFVFILCMCACVHVCIFMMAFMNPGLASFWPTYSKVVFISP